MKRVNYTSFPPDRARAQVRPAHAHYAQPMRAQLTCRLELRTMLVGIPSLLWRLLKKNWNSLCLLIARGTVLPVGRRRPVRSLTTWTPEGAPRPKGASII